MTRNFLIIAVLFSVHSYCMTMTPEIFERIAGASVNLQATTDYYFEVFDQEFPQEWTEEGISSRKPQSWQIYAGYNIMSTPDTSYAFPVNTNVGSLNVSSQKTRMGYSAAYYTKSKRLIGLMVILDDFSLSLDKKDNPGRDTLFAHKGNDAFGWTTMKTFAGLRFARHGVYDVTVANLQTYNPYFADDSNGNRVFALKKEDSTYESFSRSFSLYVRGTIKKLSLSLLANPKDLFQQFYISYPLAIAGVETAPYFKRNSMANRLTAGLETSFYPLIRDTTKNIVQFDNCLDIHSTRQSSRGVFSHHQLTLGRSFFLTPRVNKDFYITTQARIGVSSDILEKYKFGWALDLDAFHVLRYLNFGLHFSQNEYGDMILLPVADDFIMTLNMALSI